MFWGGMWGDCYKSIWWLVIKCTMDEWHGRWWNYRTFLRLYLKSLTVVIHLLYFHINDYVRPYLEL